MSALAAGVAVVTSGNADLQSAEGAGVAIAAVVIVTLLVEREILREQRGERGSALARRLTVVAIPLSLILAALTVARLRSFL